VSNRVQSEHEKERGNNFKTCTLSFFQKQTNTFIDREGEREREQFIA